MTNFRRVQEEKKGPPNGESVDFQVFHLDFKSSEWVSPENVKQLEARFLSLPGQVVRYRLANLKPEKSEGEAIRKKGIFFCEVTFNINSAGCRTIDI